MYPLAEELRRRIEREMESLRRRLEHVEAGLGRSQSDSLGELSIRDNHPADIGDETFQRSQDVAYRNRWERRLEDLEAALRRMEEGTYGYCQRCGRPIEIGRLEAAPEARLCAHCQRGVEAGARPGRLHGRLRPVEEERLEPPFGESPVRAGGADRLYDAEEAWHDVARYGTSDTPQDDPQMAEHGRLGGFEGQEEPPQAGG
ncbi:MAG: TraR/DksA C4-type zinc finger protein [Bacillota bacterium]|nr:TraR/DksA C4-type zinc finger protein [Bacillota bacterium]